jgi:carboxylesterase type B
MDLPEVIVEQGKLRGSTATDFSGKKYFKFQGIPFAEPPLGKLRFKVFHMKQKLLQVLHAF